MRILVAAVAITATVPVLKAGADSPLHYKCTAQGVFTGVPSQSELGTLWRWTFQGGGSCIGSGRQIGTIGFSGSPICSSFPGPVTTDPRDVYGRNFVSLTLTDRATGSSQSFTHAWFLGSVLYNADLDASVPVGARQATGLRIHEWEPVPSRYIPLGYQVGAGAIVFGRPMVTETTSTIKAAFAFTFGVNGLPRSDVSDSSCG